MGNQLNRSVVAIVVFVFAALFTIVWYFCDDSGMGDIGKWALSIGISSFGAFVTFVYAAASHANAQTSQSALLQEQPQDTQKDSDDVDDEF